MAEIGTIIDNKYKLTEYINKGGMSAVYLAINTRLGNRWAIKEIRKTDEKDNPLYINSLKVEANMMKDFDHPAFPRIVDIVEDKDSLYLVMDYIEGKTLEQILKEEGPQSESTVLLWSEQICGALSYLHNHQPPIIYRDMKPSNVMLKSDGSIKIIDFGVARVFNPQKTNDTIALGTRGFAPPEQYSGQTDARSDIYALGMTMMYLLTGISPDTVGYSFDSVKELKNDLSDGICKIIDKCISLNPANRYQSCNELQADILKLKNKKKRIKSFSRTKKTAIIISVALFIVLAVSGGFLAKSFSLKKSPTKSAAQATVPAAAVKATTSKKNNAELTKAATVPDVVGMTADKAKEALTKAGFKVEVAKAYSDSVEKEKVISQNEKAGTTLNVASTVKITVSDGKDPEKEKKKDEKSSFSSEASANNNNNSNDFENKYSDNSGRNDSGSAGSGAQSEDSDNSDSNDSGSFGNSDNGEASSPDNGGGEGGNNGGEGNDNDAEQESKVYYEPTEPPNETTYDFYL